MKITFLKFLMLTVFMLSLTSLIAQTKVSGTITDENGEPLPGAAVRVKFSNDGTTSDFDGNFTINTTKKLPLDIEVSFLGHTTKTVNVTTTDKLNISLESSGLMMDEVVVSASKRQEKVQEAPASISIITAKGLEVSASGAVSPIRSLVSQTGVQIQQQSAVRMNIEMRGQSAVFDTKVFPIKDYRSLVAPGMNVFDAHASGVMGIDLKRIEVVRGPGSALYGPGVTSGVVHFITKSALKHPGTTVELLGGNLSTIGASVRHAGRNEDKTFGYKINFSHKTGDDFLLDGSEGTVDGAGNFTRQLDKLRDNIYQPNVVNGIVDASTPGTLIYDRARLDGDDDGNMLEPDWFVTTADLTLEYKPNKDLSLTLTGGYNQNKSLFFNQQGEGLQQNAEYFTQGRVQYKGLFAQVYYLNNDGGTQERPTFLYQTGNRTPVGRTQFEVQAQYNFNTPKLLDATWTAGVDYRSTKQDTEHLVYGRNEDDDDYLLSGVYLQGKLKLHEKLDFIVAGRYDSFNFIDETAFSPRAAIVFKPTDNHTFRGSYNKSNTTPSNLNINIDFPLATPVPGMFDVWLVGNGKEHLFGDSPMIDITVPGIPDLPYGTPGLPLAIPFGASSTGALGLLQARVTAGDITQVQYDQVAAILTGGYAPGGVTGNFVGFDLLNGQPLDPIDSGTAKINTFDTYEFGYKGIIKDRLGVTLDVYMNKSKNFSFFGVISPTIALRNANIGGDLGSTVQSDIEQDLIDGGMDAGTAQTVAQFVGADYTAAGTGFSNAIAPLFGIFGAVESGLVPQGDNITHVAAGYRTYGEIKYVGVDFGLNYFVNKNMSVFANYSYISQTEFQGEDLGLDANSPLIYYLNVPAAKYRSGATYTPDAGFRGSFSYQYDDGYKANLGQYSGDVPSKNLIDFSVGYKFVEGFAKGATLDLGATNLLDNKYRALPNMPKIGRTVLLKLVYNIDGK